MSREWKNFSKLSESEYHCHLSCSWVAGEVTESNWYRSIKPTISPGENMRAYREMHGMTQTEFGARLGAFSRQNISNMENGHRPISKTTAKRLAEVFEVSVEKFI